MRLIQEDTLHKNLSDIIHRSAKKGGWGAILTPSYWYGVGVDALWKWRGLDDAPRMLFIFWQEVFLLEQMGELPCGAASSISTPVKCWI